MNTQKHLLPLLSLCSLLLVQCTTTPTDYQPQAGEAYVQLNGQWLEPKADKEYGQNILLLYDDNLLTYTLMYGRPDVLSLRYLQDSLQVNGKFIRYAPGPNPNTLLVEERPGQPIPYGRIKRPRPLRWEGDREYRLHAPGVELRIGKTLLDAAEGPIVPVSSYIGSERYYATVTQLTSVGPNKEVLTAPHLFCLLQDEADAPEAYSGYLLDKVYFQNIELVENTGTPYFEPASLAPGTYEAVRTYSLAELSDVNAGIQTYASSGGEPSDPAKILSQDKPDHPFRASLVISATGNVEVYIDEQLTTTYSAAVNQAGEPELVYLVESNGRSTRQLSERSDTLFLQVNYLFLDGPYGETVYMPEQAFVRR